MATWLHKWRNWEYWPVYIVYFPAFFYWGFGALSFRSIYFYRWVNPSIPNGGLFGDSKRKIYDLLPEWSYPKTVLVHGGEPMDKTIGLVKRHLNFPMVLKPDIGCRGVDVKKVNSVTEFEDYFKSSNSNFLAQEWVDLPNELGLFYCRIPGSEKGEITGITMKEFLTVEGNGVSSLRQLLDAVPRYKMQIRKLEEVMDLNRILALGEKQCLVPYGNHNRGTRFIDGSRFITPALDHYFNTLLCGIEGFYYGRLDIRFNTFEELERGENFKIIEVNGAKSEPTHIYDDQHSFGFGQREIFKHLQLMMHIAKHNRPTKTNLQT